MDVLRTAEWNQGESGAAWGVGGVTEVKQMDKCGKGGTLRRGGSGLLHHRKKKSESILEYSARHVRPK